MIKTIFRLILSDYILVTGKKKYKYILENF